MFLVIDNYDSFVHNLARYIEVAGGKTRVVRNDKITIEEIETLKPQAIIISPGPCTPAVSGICTQTVRELGPRFPILGVCLGHQAIGEAYGGTTIRGEPTHGKASTITHDGTGLFKNLPSPLNVGRYHSLKVQLAEDARVVVTARHQDSEEIMALRHAVYPVYGVQFHPESVLTEHGQTMIDNFVAIANEWNKNKADKDAA